MISNTEKEIPNLKNQIIIKRKKLNDKTQEKQDLTTGDQKNSKKIIDELRGANASLANQKMEL
jgi:hypothetical protein